VSDHTISVRGRQIPFELKRLSIYELRFYADNPRINYIISSHDGDVTQETIEHKLLALDTTKDLVKDVEENEGLIEEILVIGDEVVEGNTRLAVYRRLASKHPGDPRWTHIPAKVLSSDIKPADLFFILGTFHIKGKNEWSAYEKAAYIHRMVRELEYTPQEVARQLGHQANTVEAMLKAYETMRDSFLPKATKGADEFETQDALRKYSYFEAFYRHKELAQRAKETPRFMEEFSDWVLWDVFPKAECVRSELPKILKNKRAQKTFYELVDSDPEVAYEEAELVLHEHKPEQMDPFYIGVKVFRDLLRDAPVEEIKTNLTTDGPRAKACYEQLKRCHKELERFCRSVGVE
jgi:hypothetical protein